MDETWKVWGTSPKVGTGILYTYTVYVEPSIDIQRREFAREVDAILADKRGWIRGGKVAFQRVEHGTTQVILATPATVDELCYPLNTEGEVSCQMGTRVVLNVLRWRTAVPHWDGRAQDLPPDGREPRVGPSHRLRSRLLPEGRREGARHAAADLRLAGMRKKLMALVIGALVGIPLGIAGFLWIERAMMRGGGGAGWSR